MLTKYGLVATGTIIVALLIRIWWITGDLADATERIENLLLKNTACNISQENLRATIIKQNEEIEKFSLQVDEQNNVLAIITKKNKTLEKDLRIEIDKIDTVTYETCEDTMEWMLKEAIDENTSTSTSN